MQNAIIEFADLASGGKALKKLQQAFTRAGAPVVSVDVDPRTQRSSGVTYRVAHLTFADSQRISLMVKQSGDIFQVNLNGSVVPLKSQDDHKKAVAELVKMLDAGRAKFQAKLARVRAELPKGIRTAAPKMEVALQQQAQELDTKLADARQQAEALRAELGEPALDDAALDGAKKGLTKTQAAVIEYIKKQTNIDLSGRASYLKNKIIAVDTDGLDKQTLTAIERIGHAYGGKFRVESNGGLGIAIYINDGATFDSVATAEQIEEARALADQINGGMILDSAGLEHAKASLQIALDTVETNAPINEADGKLEQAKLERECAESFRAAIAILDSQDGGASDDEEDGQDDESSFEANEDQLGLFDDAGAPVLDGATKLTGAEKDVLLALGSRGALADGDVPSKEGRDGLIAKGYAERHDVNGEMLTSATQAGLDCLAKITEDD